MQQENKTPKTSLTLGSIFILITSYFFLFFSLSITSVALLSPWEVATEATKPQIGTYQRGLNDFFNTGGGFLIALSIIIFSIFIFLSKIKHKQNKNNQASNFTVLNLFYLFINYFFVFIAGWTTELSGIPPETGFYQILGLFIYIFLIITFLYINAKVDLDLFKEKVGKFFKKI